MNQKKRIALTTTFVGLVCGFVLTQQQAAAAATNALDSTATSMLAPENTAAATSPEPSQNNQPVDQRTNSQKAVTNENSTNETTTQIQNPGSQSTGSMTTPTAAQPNNTNSSATPAPSQKTAAAPNTETISSVNSTNDDNQSVNKVMASKTTNTAESPTSPNNNSTTTASQDPQVETIAQGTWGTSKWEYTHQGDDYILHFHAGTLGTSSQKTVKDPNYPNDIYLDHYLGSIGASPEMFNGNWQWNEELTQIIIDPGVRANQDSSYLFAGLNNLKKIVGLANLDTTNVTNMSKMFSDCDSLTSLDLNSFNTANVTDMSGMFQLDSSLTNLNISHFNTANATDMSHMFEKNDVLKSLNLSNFDTTKVTNMRQMFIDCISLTYLDLSHFNTAKVTDMRDMLDSCTNLNHLILGPDTLLNIYVSLPNVPQTGTQIPGTAKRVTSPYWVATSGYQQGHKYTSTELMNLTGRDQITTYDWDSAPAFTQTTETQTKVRTINIYRPDGQVKTYLQTAVISRPVNINADGSKTYGNWSTDQWEAYVVPELQGYTASQTQVAAQAVDPNTTDQTIDIFYAPQEQTVEVQYLANGQVVGTQKFTGYTGDTIMPNYHAPQGYEITSATPATITIDSSGKQIVQVQVSPKLYYSNEHKIITRVINVHFPSGRIQTYEQTALLERPVTINAVTGAKTYGSWNTGNWNALDVPVLDGYTASQDQVAAQQVTDQDSDQTVDVYYTPKN